MVRWMGSLSYVTGAHNLKIGFDGQRFRQIREYAAQKEVDTEAALTLGMKEKAKEFVDTGGEIYRK